MATDWFAEWVKRYSALFGLSTEADLKTMMSWKPVFEAREYTASELAEATEFLSGHPGELATEDRFSGKTTAHLAFIHRRIIDRRAVEYRREVLDQEHDPGTCTDCGGSGYVVVPHPKAIKDGVWVPVKTARAGASYYTAAVYCHCALGSWKEDRTQVDKRVARLEDYQRRNPLWRQQLAQRSRVLRLQGDELEERIAATLARLRAMFGLMPREPGPRPFRPPEEE